MGYLALLMQIYLAACQVFLTVLCMRVAMVKMFTVSGILSIISYLWCKFVLKVDFK